MEFEKTKNVILVAGLLSDFIFKQPNVDLNSSELKQIIGKQFRLVQLLNIEKNKIRLSYIQK